MASATTNRVQVTIPANLLRALPATIALLLAAPTFVWLMLGTSGLLSPNSFTTWLVMATALIAAGAAIAAARHSSRRARLAWHSLAAAAGLWGIGNATAAYAPFDPAADRAASVIFLAGYGAALAGTVLLAQPAGTRPGLRILTGALATTLSIAALLWNPILAQVINSANLEAVDRHILEAAIVANFGLIFVIFLALQDRAARSAEALLVMLSVGLGLIAAGGLATAQANSGGSSLLPVPLFQLGLVGGLALISLAAARHLDGSASYELNGDERRHTSLVGQSIPLASAIAALGVAALHPASLAQGMLPVLLFGGITVAFAHEVAVLYDQMQLNNLLRSSEAALQRRHTLIVDSSPDLIAVVDLEGHFEYANPAHAWLLGHEPASVVGTPILRVVDRRDAAAMLAVLTRAQGDVDATNTATVRFKGIDGRSRPFEAAAHSLLDAAGKPKSVVIVSRDVADRRAAERRLRSSEARKGALFSSAPDAILSVDADGMVTESNPAAAELFEMESGELSGLHFDQILSSFGDDSKSPFQNLAGNVTWGRGSVHGIACTGQGVDGQEFPAELSVSRVEGVGSEGFIVFVRDISERVRVETQLRDSQKLEAIGRLAGGVAHDFNNLLTVIHGYAEFAKSEAPDTSQLGEDVEEILKASDRARDLTRQLLAFARRQVVEPHVVSANELVGGMEKLLARLVNEDVTIQTKLEAEAGSIHIDPGQFEQVLVNLVVNSRDALPRGGTVTIMTENVEAEEAARLAPNLPPADYVVISVADTGVGMSEETIAQIFEPFFSTKGPGAGVGLGLATCYGIAKQNGGEITVESELGRGTVFRLWLARAAEPADTVAREVPREVQGGYETILFVEDERGVRTLTERYLRSLGYKVIVAGDGAEALGLLQTTHEPIHLLISDVVMPKMNGLDLADRVLARSPATHILFISGYPRDVLAERGVLPREVSLLAKPFTFEALALRIREALDRTRPQGPEQEGSEITDPVAQEVDRRLRARYSA